MAAGRSAIGGFVAVALATAVGISAGVPAKAASCPVGSAAVIDVAYVVFASDGSSRDVTSLKDAVGFGDQVNVLFNVPPLPSGCADVTLSVASYARNGGEGLALFSSQTGQFITGGRYEMQALIVPAGAATHFEIDFASGPVLPAPNYGDNRIARARG